MSDAAQVLDSNITLPLASGKSLTGRLEHFSGPRSLVIFNDDSLEPVLLTVPNTAETAGAYAALEPDQVLIRNWTELRGAPDALATEGIVELTGQQVSIGMFRLQAFVARLL
jgi:hypothetical protein